VTTKRKTQIVILALSLGLSIPFSGNLFGGNSGLRLSALQAFYQEYNQDYFGNALPQDTIITVGSLGDNMGMTVLDSRNRWHITIDKYSNPIEKQAEMTLAHEMCHVKLKGTQSLTTDGVLDDHGEAFQSCMLNLAKRGAFKDLW